MAKLPQGPRIPTMPKLGSLKGLGMDDYGQPLPYQVEGVDGQYGLPPGAPKGPIAYPTIESPDAVLTEDDYRRRVLALLDRMPFKFVLEQRKQLMTPSRDAQWWIATNAGVTVNAAATGVVVQQAIDERNVGCLEYVGITVTPAGVFNNITWSLRVNNTILSKFGGLVFNVNTLATPMPFRQELMQSCTIDITATNGGGAPVDVQAILIGWQEPLSESKTYGSSPAAGIG